MYLYQYHINSGTVWIVLKLVIRGRYPYLQLFFLFFSPSRKPFYIVSSQKRMYDKSCMDDKIR
jgi:hypothetical protein